VSQDRSIRGKVAVAGVGETLYFKHGQSPEPEFKIASGYANCIVVFRALAKGQFQRFGASVPSKTISGDNAFTAPYGVMSPAQRYAMKAMRFMHDHRIERSVLRAISMASYHHAQKNPRAVMYGQPLTEEK